MMQITQATDAIQFVAWNTYKILTSLANGHSNFIQTDCQSFDAFLPKGSQENEKVPCIDHAVLIDI